jgi:hypothetical protein
MFCREPPRLQRMLALLQHREHSHTFFTIGARPAMGSDGFQEVQTLFSEWFVRFYLNGLGLGTIREWNVQREASAFAPCGLLLRD